jgi:mitochondrial splicing suppressor protein 51
VGEVKETKIDGGLKRKFVFPTGAELQCEGDSLDKWEAFFIHLLPEVADLQIVFIGPELNTENLPIEIISRTR